MIFPSLEFWVHPWKTDGLERVPAISRVRFWKLDETSQLGKKL